MIWAFAVAAVAILYLALRFRRFQSWVEPVLTIVVAIGLAVALLVWFVEDRAPSGGPAAEPSGSTQAQSGMDIELADVAFSTGQTRTSYQVTGRVTNRSDTALQSFRLDIALSDCPDGACREVGRDSALIVLRVLPGETEAFSTFVVFPGSELKPVASPKWDWTPRDPRPYTR